MDVIENLLNQTRQLLQELVQTQKFLLLLQSEKEAALIHGDWEELHRIEARETNSQQQLRILVTRRSQLLQQFHEAGVAGKTLQEIVWNLPSENAAAVAGLIHDARNQSEQLRCAQWSLWVMAQRASRHYSQILNFISQGGKSSPCYQLHPEQNSAHGGALLDASI